MKIILSIAALLGLASATDCGKFTKCTLVNLSLSPDSNVFYATGTTLIPGTVTEYDPKDSTRGWSIECDTEGTIDYVKYFLGDGEVETHYSAPFWIRGDNNGERVNRYEDLETCGPKKIKVKFYIWSAGDEAPCDSTTIELLAKCPPTMAPVMPPTMTPVKPPTMAPVVPPTMAPVKPPTMAPVMPPTMAPVKPPTMAPVKPPTMAPVKPPTMAPVKPPTKAPVKPPTKAPVRPCYPIKCPENSFPLAENDGCVDSDHECVCLKGFHKFFGKCVRPPTMAPVKPPTKAPVKPPTKAPVRPCYPIKCPENSFPLAENDGCVDKDHECVCLKGFYKFYGKCVRAPTMAPVKPPTKAPVRPCHPITCPANSFPLAENDGCVDSDHECVCKRGYFKVRGKCVTLYHM